MPDSALSQFVVPVSLSVGDGAEFSAFLHEMAAKKLDIRFRPLPGGAPGALAATLELDGVAVSSETNAAATSQRTWRLSVAHPRNPHSATGSFSAATNFVHCLVCGFDGMSADGLVAESSRAAAAPTLVAMTAANALVASATNLPPGETARRLVAAALVADWWTRQLAGGTAIVCLGAKSLRFSRLPDGTLAAATRPSGATDSFAYDALGRMVAATNALGAVFSVEYDAAGRSVLLTDALGGETDISRDALGRPTDTLDPMGRHRAAAFDALGRRVASVRPSGAADAFAFDALDGLVAITNAEGHVHSVFRDDTGRAVAATNAAGERVFSAEWTPLGLASRTDGRGVRLEFARDAFGRILAVSEGGTNTLAAFSRDAAGAITNTTLPTGLRIRRAYDADGSLAALSDSLGHEWTFGRDAAGRRVSILHPGGSADTASYDLCGRVTAWDAGGVCARTLARNAAGECDEEFITAGPMPKPQAKFRLDLAFDPADRPTSGTLHTPSAAPQAVSFLHDAGGALAALSVSGTNILSLSHDAFGLPSFAADSTGASATFLRDPFGAIIATVGDTTFFWGGERHGDNAVQPGVSQLDSQLPTLNSGVNRLWAIDATDPLRRPVVECAADGTPVRTYLWAEDRLLGFLDASNNLTLAHCDEFGSVVALADAATSNLLFRAAYSPFGEDWGHGGVNPTPFGWLGSWGVRRVLPPASAISTPNSQLSTLYLTACRLYSPTLRRFLSPDPLGPAGGVNLYAYAAGDPLSYIDPLGLCPESTTYSRVFTAGIRGAIVFGGGIELGFAVDSDGRLGLVGKASAGFGMEVAAKNPITDTIASALSEPFLKSAGPSAGKASGTIYDLMGFEPESHASFFVGVTSDLKTSPITGVESGNIGGGVYETGTLVLPIWDPVFVRKTFDWIKERAKAVADWF